MMDMTTKRCGSCNCNKLSPRPSRCSNRFSSLTITLTTLMIFSFMIVSQATPIQLTTPIDSEHVELATPTTHEENSTKSNSGVEESHVIDLSLTDDLEQSIRESVKNEIQMDLDRDSNDVPIQGTEEFFSIEYPQKEIGDHIVITQTDKDTQTILVDGEPVREARNLHEDSNQFVNLLHEEADHESPEEEQSVEKHQEIETPKTSSSDSASLESENVAANEVDTSENVIDDAQPSLKEATHVHEEPTTNELSNGLAVEKEKKEEVVKTVENEEPSTVEKEKTSEQLKVDTEQKEGETLEEPKAEVSAEANEVINIAENTIDSEPTSVEDQEIAHAAPNKEDKENVVSTPIPTVVAVAVAEAEHEETPETADEQTKEESVIVEKEILHESDPAPTNEVHSNGEEVAAHEPSVDVVHNSIELADFEPQVKPAVVPSEEAPIHLVEQNSQEEPSTTTPSIVPEENDEEVLSVVLNENTAIAESPSNSVEKIASDSEDEIVKPEETDDDDEAIVPPQEAEHTVIKKQGVDAEEVAVETTTIKPEETHHLVIKKEGVEPVVSNDAEQSDLPEDDDNVYEDDEEEVQSPPQVVDVTEDVKELSKSTNEVAVHEAEEAKVDAEVKSIQEPIEPQPASEITPEEEAETTTPEPETSKNSSPVAYEDSAATLFESLLPRNAGQTFNDNVLTAESLGGIGKALPTRSINDTPSQRSSVIIVLCSGVAVLFVVISVTIFVVSFQRQHGTLDIEMQEKRCGKDNRDDDPESCLKLLDIELPITMLPAGGSTTTATTTPTKSTDETDSEASMPTTTLLTTNEIDECL